MTKENLIIFGTGDIGKSAYYKLKNSYNVLFFVDSNCQKQNTLLFDIKILSPEILSEYKDTLVLIASTKYFNEIFNYLNQIGISNILKLNNTISLCGGSVLQDLMTRTIDLGKLLNEINTIYLKELTFLIGGSYPPHNPVH